MKREIPALALIAALVLAPVCAFAENGAGAVPPPPPPGATMDTTTDAVNGGLPHDMVPPPPGDVHDVYVGRVQPLGGDSPPPPYGKRVTPPGMPAMRPGTPGYSEKPGVAMPPLTPDR